MARSASQARDGPWYFIDFERWDEMTDKLTLDQEAAYLRLCHQFMRRNREPVSQWSASRTLRCSTIRVVRITRELLRLGLVTVDQGDRVTPIELSFIVQHSRYIPRHVREAVVARDGFVCAYCDDERGPFDLDHIHPYSRGGTNDADNLTVACVRCNQSKSDMTLDEWRQRRTPS